MSDQIKSKEVLIKEYVANCLTDDTFIDVEKMPKNIKSLASGYFKTLFPTTPTDALCLAIYSKIAQIIAIPRMKLVSNLVKSQDSAVFINLYGILFMPSGSGKDRVLREINKQFLNSIKDDYQMRYAEARSKIIEMLQKEAMEKFGNKNEQREYVRKESPRDFTWEVGSATAEGFNDWFASLSKAMMGGVFWSNSEFEDFILSVRQENQDLMSSLKDAYDGKASMKVIKGEKYSVVNGEVPTSLLVHTSYGQLVNGVGAQKLDRFFTSGFARRSFVCFPKELEQDFKTNITSLSDLYEEEDRQKRELYESVAGYETMFKNVYDNCRKAKLKLVNFTREADIKIRAYRDFCEIKHGTLKKYENEIILKELLGRSWKTLRLAALVALLEHPEKLTVEVEDVEFAIYLAEVWGNQFVQFCQTSSQPSWLTLINYLSRPENINHWVRKVKLVQANIFQARYTNSWLAENIPLAKEFLSGTNRELQDRSIGRISEFRVVEKEVKQLEKMTISYSKNDMTTGYIAREIDFNELHTVTNKVGNYSSSIFKEGYRKNENSLGGNTLFILDVDEGWALKDAKKFIEDEELKALIVTTRHHQIAKDEKKATDRFRILLPALTGFNGTVKEYSTIMKNLIKFFLDKPDQACTNISRSYYGNPDGKYWYSSGTKMFNWSDFMENEDTKYQMKADASKERFPVTKSKEVLLRAFKTYIGENLYTGNRDNTIFRLVRWARDEGLSADDTRDLVLEFNARSTDPLTDADIIDKVRRAYSGK